jgi:hypothetical protein
MSGKPPRWTWTFNQPVEAWKSMPGYPCERQAWPEVFVERSTHRMVPAAPWEETTVVDMVASRQVSGETTPVGVGVEVGGATLVPGAGARRR